MRKIDMSSVNPANATIGTALFSAGMTADHGNPFINLAVGAGVGAAVGVGARVKQGMSARQGHRVLHQRQFNQEPK